MAQSFSTLAHLHNVQYSPTSLLTARLCVTHRRNPFRGTLLTSSFPVYLDSLVNSLPWIHFAGEVRFIRLLGEGSPTVLDVQLFAGISLRSISGDEGENRDTAIYRSCHTCVPKFCLYYFSKKFAPTMKLAASLCREQFNILASGGRDVELHRRDRFLELPFLFVRFGRDRVFADPRPMQRG